MTALEETLRAILASRFLRFGIVGGVGFVIDTSVFVLLNELCGASPYVARAFSILTAMVGTWLGNRTLTFADRAASGKRGILREWLKFAGANAIGNCLNYASFSALVALAPPPFNNRYLALVAGTAMGLLFNFTLSKNFVFRAHKPPAI